MKIEYTSFSKQEFLEDDYFIQSVKYPKESNSKFWNNWLAQNPSNKLNYEQAKAELTYILKAAKRIEIKEHDATILWERINEAIPLQEKVYKNEKSIIRWVAAASVFLVLFGAGYFGQLFYYKQQIEIATPYAKTRTIILPDSSKVTLNINSTIKYSAHWRKNQVREVWINGEAYFEVKHLNKKPTEILDSERFVVHTPSLAVQVLGTAFNVKERKNKSNVLLISGSVAVKMNTRKDWYRLKPGEQFSVKNGNQTIERSVIDPAAATAWRERSIILNANTTLRDLIPQLEENYGVRIQVESPALNNKHLEGVIPLSDRENLFFILTNVLKIDIQVRDSTWVISKPKP